MTTPRADENLTTRDIASPPERDEETIRDGTEGTEPTSSEAAATEPARDDEQPLLPQDKGAELEQPLLPQDKGAELQTRWETIQVRFVDDPRSAVEEADALVASTMQQLADGFANAREDLEGQWSRGEDASTEDLRVALQRYRSFFRRLLAA
jgi:hypothetical protein